MLLDEAGRLHRQSVGQVLSSGALCEVFHSVRREVEVPDFLTEMAPDDYVIALPCRMLRIVAQMPLSNTGGGVARRFHRFCNSDLIESQRLLILCRGQPVGAAAPTSRQVVRQGKPGRITIREISGAARLLRGQECRPRFLQGDEGKSDPMARAALDRATDSRESRKRLKRGQSTLPPIPLGV